jgi:hypothetical protein
VYVLYRDSGHGYEERARVPRGTVQFTDTDLENLRAYSYKISAIDASGNEGPKSIPILGMPQDIIPPQPPIVDPLPALTNLEDHTISGTAEPNANVVVVVDREEALTLPVEPDGTFTGTLTLAHGINRIRFKTLDPALNPSGLTPEVIVQVDLNAPTVISSQPYPDQLAVKVSENVMVVVSEALILESASAKLVFAETGVEVGYTFEYLEQVKTFNIGHDSPLEKGTTYRVVVEGHDAAGNPLTGGSFNFTTEQEEVAEPSMSTSTLLAIIILVVVGLLGAFLVIKKVRTLPSIAEMEEHGFQEENGEEGGEEMEPSPEDYDPRTPMTAEQYSGRDWEEY